MFGFRAAVDELSSQVPSLRSLIDSLLSSPPGLSWVVQSFTSDLEGKSPNEWLRQLVDSRYRDDSKAATGHQLHTLYSSVDCVPLPPPSAKTAVLRYALS
jgi:hypothetical protein